MFERVKEIIAEKLGVDVDEITEGTSFKDDLGADSLDLFELVMAFEEEYDVELPTEDMEDIHTVADILKYMKKQGVED
jgi:acyl carrier protein